MASVGVIGAGAIGGVVAARLMQSGIHAVTLAARSPVGELEVTSGGSVLRATPHVLSAPSDAHPVDWVLVATKAYDVPGAARWFPAMVGPGTMVAILQNGVEHRERFAPYLPAHQILPVVVDLPAERSAPGRLIQHRAGRLSVPAGPAGRRFSALFEGTGIEAREVPDFTTTAWEKLCVNVTGAVSALTLSTAISARDPDVALLLRTCVDEAVRVGRAEGAALEPDLVESVLSQLQDDAPQAVGSLLADRLAGRPMEIDARNGAVVRRGAAHGIPTPVNQTLVGLLRASAAATAPGRPSPSPTPHV